jgi:hypothetical protein
MRLWVSLPLTVMLAFAGVACAQESGCLTVKKISASHHALQQGGQIELTVKLAAAHCNIPIDVKSPMNKPEVSVEAAEGLEATRPVVEIGGFGDAPVIGSIWMGSEVTTRFTVHAFREASVGEHKIPATLTYTAQDANGNTASHTLALSIPVKVIAPPKPGFWDEHPEARQRLVTTGEVLLAIIVMPIWIIGSMLGFYRWDC